MPDDQNILNSWAETGKFHWWFENAIPLKSKIYKGTLGLFDVPIKNEEKIFKKINTTNDVYNIS